jgi:uncharacterized protein YuzE
MAISVIYDTSERVYTVRVSAGAIARTVEVDDVHVVDLDDRGHVVRIEVLDPAAVDLARVADQFRLDVELSEVLAAIRSVVPTLAASTSSPATMWTRLAAPAGHIGAVPGRSSTSHRPAPREIELIGNS